MLLIDLFSLPMEQVAKPVRLTLKLSEKEADQRITANIHLFESMWYGGCGYINFYTLFSNLAYSDRAYTRNKRAFDMMWDKMYKPDEDHSLRMIYQRKLGVETYPAHHTSDFVQLLLTL